MREPFTERRRWPRHSVLVDCRIEGIATRTRVRLTEMSIGGGYVDADTPLQPGIPVSLVMVLDGAELRVPARVIYTFPGRGFGFAFELEEIPRATRQQIENFLSSTEAR